MIMQVIQVKGASKMLKCSVPNNPLPWPFDTKCKRTYPQLIGSKCMKFLVYSQRWNIYTAVSNRLETVYYHQYPMTLNFDLLTPKSIGHILDSWGASAWSFMFIVGYHSQLWSGNLFQLPKHYDLDLWTFDPEINLAHTWLMKSKHMHEVSWS